MGRCGDEQGAQVCAAKAGHCGALNRRLNPSQAPTIRRKLGHLNKLQPTAILSANIGCITHLQSGADVPVRHWVELVDEVLAKSQ